MRNLRLAMAGPVLAFMALMLHAAPSHAYLDPGSSSLLYQAALAVLFGIGAGWRTLTAIVRRLFTRKSKLDRPSD